MADKRQRVAILLRGPQLAGKTRVGRLLGGKEPISLDDGNYDRLRVSDEDVLVIELGYGEGVGKSDGPTCDPGKWQRVLHDEGRKLYAFYLTADRSVRDLRAKGKDARARNVSSVTLDESDRIHRKTEVLAFAKTAGISEPRIDTSVKSKYEVADEIRAVVMKNHPGLHWPSTHR